MDMKDQYPFFLAVFGRPCSTRAPEGSVCNAHSWALRRLVSVFARTVRRPHVPREPAMRQLYLAAGVPLPEGSLQNTVWEIHSTVLISSMAIHFLKYVSPILIYIPIPKELSNTKPWFQRIIILMQGCKGGWITNYLIYTLSPFRCWEWSISTSWPWSRGWRWWGLGSRGWVGWRWRRGGSRNGGWSCVRTPAHCHSVWNPLVQPWYVILYFMVLCYEILLHDVLKPNMELEKTTTILITCFCEVCSCPTTDW